MNPRSAFLPLCSLARLPQALLALSRQGGFLPSGSFINRLGCALFALAGSAAPLGAQAPAGILYATGLTARMFHSTGAITSTDISTGQISAETPVHSI